MVTKIALTFFLRGLQLHVLCLGLWYALGFIYGVREGFNVMLFLVDIQLTQNHLFKRQFLPCWILWVPLSKIN
jgi:hypothetical protein